MTAARSRSRCLKKVLVVDDDSALCRSIERMATSWGAQTLAASTIAEARVLLKERPDVLIVDVRLPDGNGLALVREAAHAGPAPAIVVMSGAARPDEAFWIARAGASGYLPKPICEQTLFREVQKALREAPDIEPLLKAHVGVTGLREMQGWTRECMIDEALARTNGSRAGAAKLLRVSRQAMQQVMRARAGKRKQA